MPNETVQEITLLGATWKPRLPASFVIREEILLTAGQDTEHGGRALGAALGVTWGHPKVALKASYSRSGFDPRAYGGDIWDELRGLGCSIGELAEQGNRAMTAIAFSIPKQEAVEERVGFSDPATSSTDEADGVPAGLS
jgi:hypothetical protein